MEKERLQLLALFDFFWFHHHVLFDSSLPAIPLPAYETDLVAAAACSETSSTEVPHMTCQKSALRRSLSDELALATSSDSALLVHRRLKLQTILSSKATVEEEAEYREIADRSLSRSEKIEAWGHEINKEHRERKRKHRLKRRTRGTSQDGQINSLSELEFEELKGFMDLGFTFSEEAESDQRLLSIVPGLRRRASLEEGVAKEAEEGEGNVEESTISRPYLSEAWDVVSKHQERRRSHAHDHLLRNWRVPASGEGVDLKDYLRSWAHTVASAVR